MDSSEQTSEYNGDLLKEEALLKAALESTGDGILIVGNNGKVIKHNDKFARIWGIPPEIIETHDDSLMLNYIQKQLEEPQKFIDKVRQLYTSFDVDYDILMFKDGRIFERISHPLISENQVIGRVWGFKDITEQKKTEESLEKSRKKYLELYENTPVMLHSIDIEGKLISVSNYWLEVLGYKREEVLGRKSTDFLTEASRKFAAEVVLPDFFKKGHCTNIPYNYITKNGEILDILLTAISEKDDEGKVIRSLAVLSNITGLKRAEEALQESEAKYRELVNAVNDGIYITDLEGKFVFANNALENILGIKTPGTLIGRKFEEFLPPDKVAEQMELFRSHMAIDSKSLLITTEIIRDDGISSFIEIKPQFFYRSGKPMGNRGVVRDITERKFSEESAKLNEQRLRQIIDLDPNFIFAKDVEGRFFLVNQAVADAYGTTVDELLGKKDADFAKSEEEARFFREKDMEVINSGKPLLIPEEQITYPGGELRYLQTIKIPFTYSGTSSPAILGVSNDITGQKYAEKKLRESEKLLTNFFESPGALRGIVEIRDNDILVITVNNTSKDYFGFTKEEMQNKFTSELNFSRELIDLWIKKYRESRETGESLIFEIPAEKSGKWYLSIVSFIGLEKNGNPRFTFILRDITEKKKSEQENILLAQTLKSEKDAISITDMNNNIIFANDAFLSTYGFTESEIIGKNITVVHSKEISGELFKIINDSTIKGGWNGELINLRKDGTKFPVELWTSVVKDSSGSHIATVGVARDITERKLAEAALKQSEENYRSLVENLNIGVFRTGFDGAILQANNAFVKIFNYDSVNDVLEINALELYDDKEDRTVFLNEIKEKGYVYNRELRLRKKDGSLLWASLTGRATFDKNRELLWTDGIIDDISERKRTNEELIQAKEKAEESDRIKSNFLSNMSHELRTPLVGVLGYSEYLKDNSNDEEVKLMAETINKSGTRLLETLNLILDLSRVENNMLELNYKNIDVMRVTLDVMALYKIHAEKKNIKLGLNSEFNKLFATLDERLLNQILNNLINNAIKFTDSGSVTVEVNAGAEAGNEEIIIKVKDTGIGIPEDKQKIIFDEFRQASEGYSRSFEGTGLGLTITKNFVEVMNGEITLESKPGKGSVFTVRIPQRKIINETNGIDKEENGKDVKTGYIKGNYNILCVDDDGINNALVKFILRKECNVDFALDDESALELVRGKIYDVILMDINLGFGRNGLETARMIKKISGYEKIPVIALTAFAMKGDREEFLNCGCDHYLSKPYTGEELKKVIAEALNLQ